MPSFKTIRFLLGLSAAIAVTGAGRAAALERIRFGLNWLPEAEHCGFFQAKATGLFEMAGLDVELMPSAPTNVALLLAGGKQDLAMGSSLTTLNMVKNGIPGETVAALFQKDPQTLVAHADQRITTLSDMKVTGHGGRFRAWRILAVSQGPLRLHGRSIESIHL